MATKKKTAAKTAPEETTTQETKTEVVTETTHACRRCGGEMVFDGPEGVCTVCGAVLYKFN